MRGSPDFLLLFISPLNILENKHILVHLKLLKFAIDADDKTIEEANEFRASLKGKSLSYVDCIVHLIAKSRNIKFLTGDKEFEGLDNVEFVK